MIVDLHNHTILCNHATGSIDEFVQNAIEKKIDVFGFTDHAPMHFDEKYRMSFNEMEKYESAVLHVKKKYEKEIEILLGYEVDYLPNMIDSRVLESKVDYLIGSVHFLNKWGFDNPEFIGKYKDKNIDKIWEDYFDAIEDMAKTGLFDIVGHIDLIKIFKFLPTKEIKQIAQKAIKQIKKSNMVIELNSAGLRKPVKEIYPGTEIMELMREHDIPITFSSDAHKIEDINFKKSAALEYAKSFGYKKCAIFKNKEIEMVNF
jgi:histidinol-phosphatase (PHP family)